MNDKKAKAFWNWFSNHQFEYYVIDNFDAARKEELLCKLLKQLHEYCKVLYFEISENLYGKQELIISADGKESLFPVVDDLIQSAPQLEKWDFIALKPPVLEGFEINYEGILIDTNDLYFAQLKPGENDPPAKISIRLFLESYNNERNMDYLAAAWLILDSVLGERVCGENIHHVDVAGIPNPDMIAYNVKKGALFPISELKKFVDSKK